MCGPDRSWVWTWSCWSFNQEPMMFSVFRLEQYLHCGRTCLAVSWSQLKFAERKWTRAAFPLKASLNSLPSSAETEKCGDQYWLCSDFFPRHSSNRLLTIKPWFPFVFPERRNAGSTLQLNGKKTGVRASPLPEDFCFNIASGNTGQLKSPQLPPGDSQRKGWARLMSFKADLRLVAVFDFLSRVWPADSPLRPLVGSVHSLIKGNHCTVDGSRGLCLIP